MTAWWAVRKLRRLTSTTEKVVLVCSDEEVGVVAADMGCHLRIRAALIEMQMYNCTWEAGECPWELDCGMIKPVYKGVVQSGGDDKPLAKSI